jgi:hypothetical protein
MRRAILVGLGCAVAGLIAGERLERRSLGGLTARLDTLTALVQRPAEARAPIALRCAAAEPIRAELPKVQEAPREPDRDEPREPIPSVEAQAALDRGLRLIDDARQRRTWRDAERHSLHALLGQLDPAGRNTVMRQLVVALNAGQIVPDLSGAPF